MEAHLSIYLYIYLYLYKIHTRIYIYIYSAYIPSGNPTWQLIIPHTGGKCPRASSVESRPTMDRLGSSRMGLCPQDRPYSPGTAAEAEQEKRSCGKNAIAPRVCNHVHTYSENSRYVRTYVTSLSLSLSLSCTWNIFSRLKRPQTTSTWSWHWECAWPVFGPNELLLVSDLFWCYMCF